MAKEIKSVYKVVGVMAGSSLDGLDLAEVVFIQNNGWSFELLNVRTIPYDSEIRNYLATSAGQDLKEQQRIDLLFGDWIAKRVKEFSKNEIDLISVHGHTVIHSPLEQISWQLGNGQVISDLTRTKVVTDFRSQDVKLGGQGAPLVPVGDFQLLEEFDGYLNLGGIANISIRNKQLAWDICPCNQVLNYFANKLGSDFDEGGKLARGGESFDLWKSDIGGHSYFKTEPPKSLPNQFFDKNILEAIKPIDGLRSYSEFIVDRIVCETSNYLASDSKILTTGGGAHNSFLIELLNNNSYQFEFVVPDDNLIDFKEAIVFGFLGVLRMRNEVNVLASVTGSSRDTSSGAIHYPK